MLNVGISNSFCYCSELYIEEVYWGGIPEFMWKYPVLNFKKINPVIFQLVYVHGK